MRRGRGWGGVPPPTVPPLPPPSASAAWSHRTSPSRILRASLLRSDAPILEFYDHPPSQAVPWLVVTSVCCDVSPILEFYDHPPSQAVPWLVVTSACCDVSCFALLYSGPSWLLPGLPGCSICSVSSLSVRPGPRRRLNAYPRHLRSPSSCCDFCLL